MASESRFIDAPRWKGHINNKQVAGTKRKREAGTRCSTVLRLQAPPSLPQTTPYEYQQLDKEKNAIRLLTLLRGEVSDEIRLVLNHVSFDPENPPQYEALSYVWGSAANPASCRVGQTGNRTISITENLAIALPYLRYTDRARILWIDAICVNQLDPAERSEQVQLMANIYRLATRVVGWVGTEADQSSAVLKIMNSVGKSIDVNWRDQSITPRNFKGKSWANWTKCPTLSKARMRSINAFIMRPWFERLWVRQEICLASYREAILVCGSAQIPWEVFGRFISAIRRKPNSHELYMYPRVDVDALENRIEAVEAMCGPHTATSFGFLAQSTEQSKCSDDRDRIYGLLGMYEQSASRLQLKPNYELPVGQVYQAATVELMRQAESLRLLSNCELRSDNKYEMPSWVPDFSIPRLSRLICTGEAAGWSVPVWECLPRNVLRVRGTRVGRLLDVQEILLHKKMTENRILSEIRRLKPSKNLETPYPGGGTLLEAYCEAFVCGDFAESQNPSMSSRSYDSSKKILRKVWETDADQNAFQADGIYHDYISDMFSYCDYRTLCTTEQGLIVLAPETAQAGDQVCVILGAPKPLLLRPAGKTQWQVIGECYVPGRMAGEALAGPLPENYRLVVFQSDILSLWMHNFRNIVTGEVQLEDPRFNASDHPEDSEESMIWNLELPTATEEDAARIKIFIIAQHRQTRYLWREENFLKRGVQLQDFDLI